MIDKTEKKSRILGLAFLVQFVASFTGMAIILPLATGVKSFGPTGDMARTLASIAGHAGLVHLDILLELLTAGGVIFLGAMLYVTVRKQHEGLALTAFGLYVLEGALIAVSKLALFGLLVLSRQFVAAGSPASMLMTAGLIDEIMQYSSKLLNLAFCLGGTIFYALLAKARAVALPLSIWGLVGAQGVLAGVLLGLLELKAPALLYFPYIPFELAIGVWILVKGVKKEGVN
jgi:hypothetical protein